MNPFTAFTALVFCGLAANAQDKPGWKMIWADEFTEGAVNPSKWTLSNEPANTNSELQYYSNRTANAFIDSGSLVLRAIKESFGGRNYTSAKMISRMKGDWLYGRFEVRAKLNAGKGIWPAIWMMPTDNAYGGWPSSGEMDIMELLGHQPAKVYGTVHWNAGGHQQQGSSKTLAAGSFADGYHVFAYEWEAGAQRWFIDDVQYFATAKSQPFDKRFYLILNVAVGGSWPGNPDASTPFPNDMSVDYVRVFQKTAMSALVPERKINRLYRLGTNAFQGEAMITAGEKPVQLVLRCLSGAVVEERHLRSGERFALGGNAPVGIYVLEAVTGGSRTVERLCKTR
jgi:beta-glucanase (GH16 family)